MKKILIRIVVIAALLFAMNWVYSKWFYKKDLVEHSDIVELSWKAAEDSCRIIYLGESSNHTYGSEEIEKGRISAYMGEYFPGVKSGDLTKSASHAQTYYYMLKQIPQDAAVEAVVVTMNLRSFGAGWIYSRLETALRKQLVLLKDYPPLLNRFLLAFKAYPIRTEAEWDRITRKHWEKDPLDFPYEFEWHNTHQWDSAMAWGGLMGPDGQKDEEMTVLACHYIKSYAFTIKDDNPRLKDFDDIVDLCHERGWKLVFNLMAENVDKVNELVGGDLVFLMKRNRDYLMKRYGDLKDVKVVDNLNLLRDVNFIDQNWTTEHYYAEGRRIIARNVALALKEWYPDDFVEARPIVPDEGHYCFGETIDTVYSERPYSATLKLFSSDLHEDWEKVNVSVMMLQADTMNTARIVVQWYDSLDNSNADYSSLRPQVKKVGQWDFATFVFPVDARLRESSYFKIYLFNPSSSRVLVKGLDISFRPAFLSPGIKGKRER